MKKDVENTVAELIQIMNQQFASPDKKLEKLANAKIGAQQLPHPNKILSKAKPKKKKKRRSRSPRYPR